MLSESKRRLLHNKQIVPNTFVFFFHKGPRDTSWGVRDYSVRGSIAVGYASDFQDADQRIPAASEIRAGAQYDFPAPRHPTTDFNYWHSAITAKNVEYLAGENAVMPALPVLARQAMPGGALAPSFPVLNLSKLLASPKSQKRGDIDRILHSANSEDMLLGTSSSCSRLSQLRSGGRRFCGSQEQTWTLLTRQLSGSGKQSPPRALTRR